MATVNLSFPDSDYSASNKPSITTLKDDLTALEAAINALTNDNIAAAAAIAYSKLNLTGGIVNADINAAAAIAMTKLADFVAWTDFSPTFGNLSANPTFIYFRYTKIGKVCIVSWRGDADGTKNGSDGVVTMTLPIAPKYAQTWWDLQSRYSTNRQVTSGTVSAGSTTLTMGQITWGGAGQSTYLIEQNLAANLAFGFSGCVNTLIYEVA